MLGVEDRKKLIRWISNDAEKAERVLDANQDEFYSLLEIIKTIESQLQSVHQEHADNPKDLIATLNALRGEIAGYNEQLDDFLADLHEKGEITRTEYFQLYNRLSVYGGAVVSSQYDGALRFSNQLLLDFPDDAAAIIAAKAKGEKIYKGQDIDHYIQSVYIDSTEQYLTWLRHYSDELMERGADATVLNNMIAHLGMRADFYRECLAEGAFSDGKAHPDLVQNFEDLNRLHYKNFYADYLESLMKAEDIIPQILFIYVNEDIENQIHTDANFKALMDQRHQFIADLLGREDYILNGQYDGTLSSTIWQQFEEINQGLSEYTAELGEGLLISPQFLADHHKPKLIVLDEVNYHFLEAKESVQDSVAFYEVIFDLKNNPGPEALEKADERMERMLVAREGLALLIEKLGGSGVNREPFTSMLRQVELNIEICAALRGRHDLTNQAKTADKPTRKEIKKKIKTCEASIKEIKKSKSANKLQSETYLEILHEDAFNALQEQGVTLTSELIEYAFEGNRAVTDVPDDEMMAPLTETSTVTEVASEQLHHIRDDEIIIEEPKLETSTERGNYRFKDAAGKVIHQDTATEDVRKTIDDVKNPVEKGLVETYQKLNEQFSLDLLGGKLSVDGQTLKLDADDSVEIRPPEKGKHSGQVVIINNGTVRQLTAQEKKAYQDFYEKHIQNIADDVFEKTPELSGLAPNFHTATPSRLLTPRQPAKRLRTSSPAKKKPPDKPGPGELDDIDEDEQDKIAAFQDKIKGAYFEKYAQVIADPNNLTADKSRLSEAGQGAMATHVETIIRSVNAEDTFGGTKARVHAAKFLRKLHNDVVAAKVPAQEGTAEHAKAYQAAASKDFAILHPTQSGLTAAAVSKLIENNPGLIELMSQRQDFLDGYRKIMPDTGSLDLPKQDIIDTFEHAYNYYSGLVDDLELNLEGTGLNAEQVIGRLAIQPQELMVDGKVPLTLCVIYRDAVESIKGIQQEIDDIIVKLELDADFSVDDPNPLPTARFNELLESLEDQLDECQDARATLAEYEIASPELEAFIQQLKLRQQIVLALSDMNQNLHDGNPNANAELHGRIQTGRKALCDVKTLEQGLKTEFQQYRDAEYNPKFGEVQQETLDALAEQRREEKVQDEGKVLG